MPDDDVDTPRGRTRTLLRPPDTPGPDLPDEVVMPLLDRIVRQSVDEDYQVAATRKGGARPGPGSARGRQVAAAVMAVFGVLVAIAAVQTARNAPAANASMASLVEQAQQRRDALAELQAELDRLRTSTNDLRTDVAEASEAQRSLTARVSRLEARTGLGPVTGPGVRITVDDAPQGDLTQQVRDSDLAVLVDGLWNAGAEAISVNGIRLTNLTAFDNVGPAIHIAGSPLVRPYTILAVGDPDTMAADLLDSTSGQRWYALVDTLGFVYDAKPAESLSLPAARPQRLRAVRLLTDEPERPAQDPAEGAP